MFDILIKARYLLPVDDKMSIIENGALAVQGDKIVDVGQAQGRLGNLPAKKVIEAPHHLAMPGLINAHVHLEGALSRGLLDDIECVPWIRKYAGWFQPALTDESYYYSALLSCIEMLKSGTTAFCDCGTMPAMEESAYRAVEKMGMRAVLGRTIMDAQDDPTVSQGIPAGMKESAAQALKNGEEFIRKYHKSAQGRIQAWLNLRQVQSSSDELCLGVKELAAKHGVGILTHAAVVPEMVGMSKARYGLAPIERLASLRLLGPNFLAAHMGWINGKELLLLKEQGVNVVHIAGSSMHGAYGSVARGLFPEMVSMGINVALGVDGASCGNHLDMIRQLYLVACAHKEVRVDPAIFPAPLVVRMGTVNGARALLLGEAVGSLKPGMKADIILLNLKRPEWTPVNEMNLISNLVYAAHGDCVETAIVDGQILMENRKVLKIDEEEVLARCQEYFQEVCSSLGP